MLFLKSRGLSTVELLITLALLGGVVYSGLSMLEKQKLQIIKANQEIQMTAFTYEVRELIQERSTCQQIFKGRRPNMPEGEVTYLYKKQESLLGLDPTWEGVLSDAQIREETQGPAQLGLKGYSLSDAGKEVGPEDQTTELMITFDRGKLFPAKERFAQKKIKVFYELNAAKEIQTCALTALKQDSPFWESQPQKNQLIYLGDSLASGHSSAAADLDVLGPVFIKPLKASIGPQNCSAQHQGQLIALGVKRRLFYCDSRQWRLLAP